MWPEAANTQELLLEIQGGDTDAVNRLLERHRESVRKLVGFRLDPALARRVDASDIVQEVMIDAHRRLDDYLKNPSMPFHLWLRQMAMDRMIDAHRRHRVAGRRSLDREQRLTAPAGLDQSTFDLAAQLCDHEPTPAAAATYKELQRRFHTAVNQLDEQDREVVLMRHFEQLSNSETARALSLTPQASGMRYLRAMRRLRELLDDTDLSMG